MDSDQSATTTTVPTTSVPTTTGSQIPMWVSAGPGFIEEPLKEETKSDMIEPTKPQFLLPQIKLAPMMKPIFGPVEGKGPEEKPRVIKVHTEPPVFQPPMLPAFQPPKFQPSIIAVEPRPMPVVNVVAEKSEPDSGDPNPADSFEASLNLPAIGKTTEETETPPPESTDDILPKHLEVKLPEKKKLEDEFALFDLLGSNSASGSSESESESSSMTSLPF